MDELEKEEKGAKNRVKKDSRLRYALISFLKKTKHNLCGDIHDLLVDLDKLPNMECDPITLDYREYAKKTVDLVDRLRDLLDRTVGNRRVTKFCFCGSSSRVPAVLKMYREFAQHRGRFSEVVQADETVARGMCYWGFLRTVDVPKVKSIPVMLNRKVMVDRMEDLQKWREKKTWMKREETDKGAIVLPGVKSREVTLTSTEGEHGITAFMGDMPLLTVWTCAPKHGQYLCIEPMLSFGFASRTLDIEEMEETVELKKGEKKTYANFFRIF